MLKIFKPYISSKTEIDSEKSEINLFRLYCLLGVVLTIAITIIISEHQNNFNVLIQGLISFTFLSLLILTYLFKAIKKQISNILLVCYVLIALYTLYDAYIKNFTVNDTFGLIIVFFIFSIVLKNPKQVIAFFAIVGTSVLVAMIATKEPEVSKPHLFVFSLIFFSVGYVVIHSRAKVVERLQERENFLKTLFNKTFDAILLVEYYSRTVVDCNDVAIKLFEVEDKSEIVGYPRDKFQKHKMTEDELIACRKEFAEKGKWTTQAEYVSEKGREFWVELILTPLNFKETKYYVTRLADITSKKEAEQAMLKSEVKYRTLVENMNEGILRVDNDRVIKYANERFCEITGYSMQELIGTKETEILIDESDPTTKELLKKVYTERKHGISSKYEIPLTRKNNDKIWVQISGAPMFDENGNISGSMGIITDITEKKKAEEKIIQSEERYKTLFERNLAGVYRSTFERKIIACNDAFARILGFDSKEEVLNQIATDLYADSSDRVAYRETLMREGKMTSHESMIELKNGKHIWILENASLIYDNNGKPELMEGTMIDITELKKTEQALKNSEEKFRLLFERNMAGVFTTSIEGIVLECNEAYAKMLGYSKRMDLIGRNITEFYFDLTERKKYLAELTQKKTLTSYELCQKTKKGKKIRVLENVSLTENEKGELANIEGTAIDITELRQLEREQLRAEIAEETNVHLQQEIKERIKAEKQLLDTQKYTRSIIDSSLDMICATDKNGKITEFNHAAQKTFGYKPNEIIGKDISVLYARPSERKAVIPNLLIGKGVFVGEIVNRRKNGKEFISYLSASSLKDEDGKIVGMMGVSRDITDIKKAETELKESEERYRNLAARLNAIIESTSNTMIWTLNKNFEITSFNKIFFNTMSRRVGIKIKTGDNFLEFIKTTIKERLFDEMVKLYRDAFKGEPQQFEGQAIDKKGVIAWIETFLNPIYMEDGKIDEISCLAHDITDKKRIEREIRHSLEEKEVLLKEVHHRVKNNLQVISSILNLQSSFVKDPVTLEILRESQNRIKSMSFIHEHLYQTKDFSHINIADYVLNLSKNIVHSFHAYGEFINMELDVDDIFFNLDQAIPCGLIINELLTNSFKYAFPAGTPDKKGNITVSIKEDRNNVRMIISDNGIGLPEKFDFRNSDTLGLQLVTTLVEQIEGKIKLDLSNGTKFIITFKRQK